MEQLTAPVVLGIRVGTLVAAGAMLLATLVLQVIVRWWTRRATSERGFGKWFSIAITELARPLLTLLWIHAIALTARVVLGDLDAVLMAGRIRFAIDWIADIATLVVLAWGLARAGEVIERMLVRIADKSESAWDDFILPLVGRAARRLLPLLSLVLAAPLLSAAPALGTLLTRGSSVAVILVIAYLLVQVVNAGSDTVLKQYRMDVANNLEARAIHTQVMVLRKVALTVIVVFAAASTLMVFDSVRQFGASILASAGIASLIVGLAAQQSIATMLAGFQIAITQPIRVDDVVIVEGEWGKIEEITLTYVVVCIWDLRRLVLPITYFIQKPFQNWTRVSSDILGTVFLQVDYRVPLEELRAELTRILESSPLWDRKVNVLQVTDSKPHVMEIRALASASDAGKAWDLRCDVREKLVTFLQEHHPYALPRLRAEVAMSEPA